MIVRRPDVLFGKPTSVDTRTAVKRVLHRLGDRWSDADLIAQHPRLKPGHLRAAMAYAAASLAAEEVVLLAPPG